MTWLGKLLVAALALIVLAQQVSLCSAAGSTTKGGKGAATTATASNATGVGGETGRVPRPEDSANGEGVVGFLVFECLVLAAFAASQLSLRRQRDRKSRAYYKMVRTSSDNNGNNNSNGNGAGGRHEVEMTDIP